MNSIAAIKETLNLVHEYLEAAIQDTDAEVIGRKLPGATIGTIGEIYGHAISAEDWAIQEMIRGTDQMLTSDGWGDRLGIDASAKEPDWLTVAQTNMSTLKEYAQAVFKATDEYLSSLSDADLDREVDFFGRQKSVGWVLADTVLVHLPFHAGEIASLKGVMGLKGLPW